MLLYLLAVPLVQSLLLVCLRIAVAIRVRVSQEFLEQLKVLSMFEICLYKLKGKMIGICRKHRTAH